MKLLDFEGCISYATRANAVKALAKKVPPQSLIKTMIAVREDGRFIPVAIGSEALQQGLHFAGIAVVG